jgi:hypothetical protein
MTCAASPNLIPKTANYETTTYRNAYFGPVDIHFEGVHTFANMPPGITASYCVVVGDNNNYYRFQGTPTVDGDYDIYTTDTSPNVHAMILHVVHEPVPKITTTLSAAVKGKYYRSDVGVSTTSAYDDTTPVHNALFSFTGLPYDGIAGMELGRVSGTPTFTATHSVGIHVTCDGNANGIDEVQTLTVGPALPYILPTTPKTVVVGQTYEYAFLAPDLPEYDGGATYASQATSYDASGLPAGLTCGTTTIDGRLHGYITGTPTDIACAKLCISTIKATNAAGTTSRTTVFDLADYSTPTLTSGATLNKAYINESYRSAPIRFSPCVDWLNVSSLPSGMTFSTLEDANGSYCVVTGTTTGATTATLDVAVQSAYGKVANETLTLNVGYRPPVFNYGTGFCETNAFGLVDESFSQSFSATGAASYSASGLPTGLSINVSTGVVSGTVTDPADEMVTITATSPGPVPESTSVVVRFLFTDDNAEITPEITSATSPRMADPYSIASGISGVAFDGYTITATFCPTVFGASDLPPGLSVNTATGVISGTPTTPGNYNTTVTASRTYGTATLTGSATVSFVITYPAPVITSPLSTFGFLDMPFDPPVDFGGGDPAGYHITATGDEPEGGFVITATGLPTDLVVNDAGNGIISGTITDRVGKYTISLTVSNEGAYEGVPSLAPTKATLILYIYRQGPIITNVSPNAISSAGGQLVTVTGKNFEQGMNFIIGNLAVDYWIQPSVKVNSETEAVITTGSIPFVDSNYDLIAQNVDGQAGVWDKLKVFPPGAGVGEICRYTSVSSDLPARYFGLGTNVEVLAYSGVDTDNRKILNVYRKQLGTSSTPHEENAVVLKGIASVKVSPFLAKAAGNLAHVDCLLRGDGRIMMKTMNADTEVFIENTDIARASYMATLVKPLTEISLPTAEDCE